MTGSGVVVGSAVTLFPQLLQARGKGFVLDDLLVRDVLLDILCLAPLFLPCKNNLSL
jgi:hypothetical protein